MKSKENIFFLFHLPKASRQKSTDQRGEGQSPVLHGVLASLTCQADSWLMGHTIRGRDLSRELLLSFIYRKERSVTAVSSPSWWMAPTGVSTEPCAWRGARVGCGSGAQKTH